MIRRNSAQSIRLRRRLPVALFAGGALSLWSTTLLAANTSTTALPAARWPMVLAMLVLFIAGLWLMGLRQAFFELNSGGKIRRVLGVILVSFASFGALFALTEAPPGGGSVSWVTSIEEGRAIAQATDRPLIVDFTADWCAACKELEAEVFQQPDVQERLETEFVPVRLDYDSGDPETIAAIQHFQVTGLPRIGFETSSGVFLSGPSFDGKVGVAEFENRLDRALAGDEAEQAGWLESALGANGLWAVFLLVFGAGILSSLSPCIYPLIPITIGLFGARQATTRRQAFLLSLSYVGGIVVTYSILGMSAALLGTVFGGFLQNIWLQMAIALLFIVLGMGSLGVYDFRLPAGLQAKLNELGGIGFVGAFVMGLGAGIIAAPCVGPVVAGVLLYVAQQGSLFLGWSLLTIFAAGMGLLFIVLGTFSSLIHRLPRAGGWMEGVKAVMGAVFIGIGVYYLRLVVGVLGQFTEAIWLFLGG